MGRKGYETIIVYLANSVILLGPDYFLEMICAHPARFCDPDILFGYVPIEPRFFASSALPIDASLWVAHHFHDPG